MVPKRASKRNSHLTHLNCLQQSQTGVASISSIGRSSDRFPQSTLASQSLAIRRRKAVGERFVPPATPSAAVAEKRMYGAPRRVRTGQRFQEGSLSVASISSTL